MQPLHGEQQIAAIEARAHRLGRRPDRALAQLLVVEKRHRVVIGRRRIGQRAHAQRPLLQTAHAE